MGAAATSFAEFELKSLCFLLARITGFVEEQFDFLRCFSFSFSSNAIFSGVLVQILIFPNRDRLVDHFGGGAFGKESKAAAETHKFEEIVVSCRSSLLELLGVAIMYVVESRQSRRISGTRTV